MTRVFLELDIKRFTYKHARGGWYGNIYHESQSSQEWVRGPGKEDSTKFFSISSPAPWTTHPPTHILLDYCHLDIPVVSLVPLVQFCYSSFPLIPTHEYESTKQIQTKIGQCTHHSSPPPISFTLKYIRTLTTIMMNLLPGTFQGSWSCNNLHLAWFISLWSRKEKK